jgi:hypothetical protein
MALALLIGPALAVPTVRPEEGDRWAVVIGVSSYPGLDLDGGRLPGAAEDARAVREALVDRRGYPVDHVRLLLDEAATRAAVEEALVGWLGSRVAPGDHVLVYFAGLGSRIPDRDGDERDGFDETLVPADARAGSAEGDIPDDLFGAWMDGLASTEIVVVLDRGGGGVPARASVPGVRGRTLRRASAVREEPDAPDGAGDGFDAGGPLVLAVHPTAPGEEAVEVLFGRPGVPSYPGGALTTHLLRALWRSGPAAPHPAVVEETARTLRRDGFGQAPGISGAGVPGTRPLMAEGSDAAEAGTARGVLTVRAVHAPPVGPGVGDGAADGLGGASRDGRRVELAAGARLGLLPGSVLEGPGGARLVLETVRPDASRGRVVGDDGAGAALAPGDPLRLVGRPFPAGPLRVGIGGLDQGPARLVREALDDSARVVLLPAPDEGTGAADLHLLPEADGTLRVVGRDGYERRTGLAAGDAETLAELLRGEAARTLLARMDHPLPPFRVELRLEGGRERFAPGETMAFHVTSERAGFLTLVDVGTDGMVSVLLPSPERPAVRVEAGQTLTFPGEEMGFALGAMPPVGRAEVAAFVTPRPLALPLDEGYLEGDERLVELLARALADAAGSVEGAVRLGTWSSTLRTYEIRD